MHDTAAQSCSDADVTASLKDLSQSRRKKAEALGRILENESGGPLWPEPEKELLSKFAVWVRSSLSSSPDETLISACRDAEVAIRDAAEAVLQREVPEDVRERVTQIKRDSQAKIADLSIEPKDQ